METQFDNYSFLIVQAPASLYKDKLVFIVNGSTKGQGRTYPFKPAGFYYSDGSNWIFKGATNTGGTGTVTSVDITSNATAITITGNPITTAGAIDLGFNGAITDYIDGTGDLQVFPSLTGFVPYTGATTDVDLGLFDITATTLIKAGGTSSQFLKADGSVDSTTYGTGTVTSIATAGLISGGTITNTGTITTSVTTI